MASTYVRRPETPFARWMAVMAIAAMALAPVPVSAQSNAGEAEQQASEQKSNKKGAPESEKQSDQRKKTETRAGETPSLYLLPVDRVQSSISDIVPQRIDDLVRKDVKSDGRVQLRPELGTGDRDDTAGSRAVAEARKKYRSGIGLVSAGEYEDAVETLSTSVSTMKEHIEHLRNFGVLVDALKNLARAYGEAGYDFDARTTMREFAHLKPDASLDPKKFSEKLRRIYKAEAKKVRNAGPGKLAINATSNGERVEGATVVIDGVEKGKTPITVSDVRFGYHYLVVRGPKGKTVGTKRLQVRGRGESQTFTVALTKGDTGAQRAGGNDKEESLPAFYTDLRESLRSGRFEQSSLKPYLNELSEEAEAELIAWVLMTRDDDGYNATPFAYRSEDEQLVRGEQVEFDVQLSNLRAGVSELSDHVVKTATQMKSAEATKTVALVGEGQGVGAEGTETASATSGQSTSKSKSSQSGGTAEQAERVDPPPQPEQPTQPKRDSGISPWWYVAGSAVVVGGLAAGGAVLLSNPGNPTKPEGFEAQVSW